MGQAMLNIIVPTIAAYSDSFSALYAFRFRIAHYLLESTFIASLT